MNHISILIVDDDFKKISLIIKTIREVFTETLSIKQASCVQEAFENLQKHEFHLLITDLQMPIKFDDSPNDRGGEVLVKEMYKKKNRANIPIYIIGLTQFPSLKDEFNSIWKVWCYDPSEEGWKVNLRDLIFHISLIKTRILVNKIETMFVEGTTDRKIIQTCINKYFSELSEKVFIDAIGYGGGASWVERQLFIWAKSLTRNEDGNYLKAIGVFDDDTAGNTAIQKIRDSIEVNSAESKTFSIIKACYKYSPILKVIKSKGITLPTTIEDLMPLSCWKIAEENGWLTNRNINKIIVDKEILNIECENISSENLKNNNFSQEEILIITKAIHPDSKQQFCNLVCNDSDNLKFAKYMVEDCLKKLKLISEEISSN